MLNYRKNLRLIALVCTLVGLAGCGGASGTKNDTTPPKVCGNFQIVLSDGSCGAPPPKPPCDDGFIRPSPDAACVKSDFKLPTLPAVVAEDEAVIYFNKEDKNFAGYTLYTWQACSSTWLTPSSGWSDESQVISSGAPDPIYGAYFIVKLKAGGTCGNFIIRSAGQVAKTNDLTISTAATGSPFDRRFFVIADASNLLNSRTSAVPICINDVCAEFKAPKLAISNVAAHWVDPATILWDRALTGVKLYAANEGAKIIANEDGSVANATVVAELAATTLNDTQKMLVPHLAAYNAYALNVSSDVAKKLLKKELVIVGQASDGRLYGTRLQNAQVLDALYTAGTQDANESTLGIAYAGANISVSVWAPTAKKVELRLFNNSLKIESTKAMVEDAATGIWSYTAAKTELDGKPYRFRVTGYNQFTNTTETLETTDPESISLIANGLFSQIVDLNDAQLKPAGWDNHVVPEVTSPEAMSIYETHVRDFSISDQSTPAAHRGKYLAFTDSASAPVKHLKALAMAGLTHVHLLPVADGSSINEFTEEQINLDSYVFELCAALRDASLVCHGDAKEKPNATLRSVLNKYPAESDNARALVNSLKELDGFNWNYDPEHFNAPEGSYATDANSPARIFEARAMNMALHSMGLRVVYDVVYPHMAASGIKTANSTFDKIVPGYYFRQNIVNGAVETGTGAGPDTATEHVMVNKFVSDSLVQWAVQYKVDGFRFDQSGYMPKATLVNAYNAVKAVDSDNYFYAEAWTASGGTSADRITERASQLPLAGSGIGTFNDRIRNPLRELALVNGGNLNAVRAGLAGNLSDFLLLARSGKTIKGSSVNAYGVDPQEAINYVEKHDNETLWDWMHKPNALPEGTSIENRVRIQDLTLSVPLLSQGVPFIQAGSDLLRSKSMSGNSYNAGDWFNTIDFTKQSNNWAVGLPPEPNVTDQQVKDAFADTQSKPTSALIQKSSDVFNEFLAISKSSKLFSLTTAIDVMDRVGFHDGGVTQKDNLIVMSIDDGAGNVAGTSSARADLDPAVDAIVVIFNGNATEITHKVLTATGFTLHSLQKNSADASVRNASFVEAAGGGSFTVPAYTTAVFIKPQVGAQDVGLAATATSGYEPPVPFGETAIYVRGSVTNPAWDTADASNQLAYESNGIYAVNLPLAAGSYEFKVASSDWNKVDRGVAPENPDVLLGTAKAMQVGGGGTNSVNLKITIAEAGTYRFELNALNAVAPTLKVTDTNVFKGTSIYVRGTVTNPAWGTADTSNELVHEGNSIYAKTLSLAAGSYEFKVASSDWNTVDRGVAPADPMVVLGTVKAMQVGGGGTDSVNAKVVITTASQYRFELNAKNPTAPLLKIFDQDVFKGTAIYLRGTVTTPGWDVADATNELTYKGAGNYSVTMSLAAGEYAFKVASANWSTVDRGVAPANPLVAIGVPKTMQLGGSGTDSVNLKVVISVAGNYEFTLNAADALAPILTVKPN